MISHSIGLKWTIRAAVLVLVVILAGFHDYGTARAQSCFFNAANDFICPNNEGTTKPTRRRPPANPFAPAAGGSLYNKGTGPYTFFPDALPGSIIPLTAEELIDLQDAALGAIQAALEAFISIAIAEAEAAELASGITNTGARCGGGEPIEGFAAAAGVTGGAGGRTIVVTNLNSSGPGSLREAVQFTTGPRIVTFAPGLAGTIYNSSHIWVNDGDLTIDGAGADITLSGASINISTSSNTAVSNVIIQNLTFVDTMADKSAIYITSGSHDIWIDHNTFSNNSTGETGQPIGVWNNAGVDGLIGITISYNHFTGPNKKSVIVGSAEQTVIKNTRVSIHHNWFDGVDARNPRVHGGTLVHMWNNYISNWGEYALGASARADVLAQNNIFEAGGDSDASITDYGGPSANSVNGSGNWLTGSPTPTFRTVGTFPTAKLTYSVNPEVADNALKQRIIQCAGR